jgi:hypothetical protein
LGKWKKIRLHAADKSQKIMKNMDRSAQTTFLIGKMEKN